ncbi:MAG: DUF3789 domain-containing protein [Ruminococcus sp.]|uniref:DUF3789 domain-containing protein n=1 Tax=Ruminococcus bovis TaxID=2564099 RepID=A0A4P8XXI4_9FIRM|nr:DUF3789 domain-containing protein [Oscillospiraceae bacterium]MCI5598759.1 YtxH domain-containing protein [Ruminococcus sp.]QCT07895.1 DUF3789 domain-containing protein [Ruminococcus bovis]MCI5616844.1 YtxH domain-containing protein [Ruminococcus sp.]HAR88584.1 hypothetical protein [Oscillospiraceae bacterium]
MLLGFIIGLFVGALIGIFLMCLLQSSNHNKR